MMIAMPWYLLAAGCVLLIVGFLVGGLGSSGGSARTIDPRMRDEDIARQLNSGGGGGFAGVLVILGVLLIAVSLLWRLARFFV
jgi:hypothetical protein